MDIQPDLSVYVVDDGGDLPACVKAVLGQNDPVLLELLLPRERGLEELFGARSEVVFVDLPHTGFGQDVYAAWQQGRGRYSAALSSTIHPGPGSFLAMLGFLDDHPDVGATAPRLFSAENILKENCFRRSLLPRRTPAKMKGWDGRSLMEIDWMAPEAVFVNGLAFADCLPASFKGESWSKNMCTQLKAKGWHQFFVHYAKMIVV